LSKGAPSPERQGVAKSALTDTNEEGSDGFVCQQLLCLSSSDDAMEPLVQCATRLPQVLELRCLEPTDRAFVGMSMSVCDCLLWGVHRKGESHIHTGATKFLFTVCPLYSMGKDTYTV